MNVAQWLNAIDLGEYEALFREHAIDAEVLPELTDADLEKFGVPFGHRKRLIKAIAKLGASAPEQAETAPPAPPTLLRTPPPNGGISPSCSAISWAQPPFRPRSTPRIGAIWSAPTSTLPRRR